MKTAINFRYFPFLEKFKHHVVAISLLRLEKFIAFIPEFSIYQCIPFISHWLIWQAPFSDTFSFLLGVHPN